MGFRHLLETSRLAFVRLIVTRFLFSSRKVFKDCAFIDAAYEYGRIPWNSNIPQATVDMQRVHVVFNSRNHDSYPFPSNQFPWGICQVSSFERSFVFSMSFTLQLFLVLNNFHTKKFLLARIMQISSSSDYFLISVLLSNAYLRVCLSRIWTFPPKLGLLGVNSTTLAANMTHWSPCMKVARWQTKGSSLFLTLTGNFTCWA